MKLTEVSIKGFKSIDNLTGQSIRLGDVTVLLGANGSGKSNVTDGIRFALGEMSLRSLRASRISELINQSSTKAEVTLCIDGEQKFEQGESATGNDE